jgi:hypothetical protein
MCVRMLCNLGCSGWKVMIWVVTTIQELPIVEGQISKAGVRLAAWINTLAVASWSSNFVVQGGREDL